MKRLTRIAALIVLLALISGCGSGSSSKKAAVKDGQPAPGGPIMAENTKHPYARYIEVAGFRITEPKPGRLRVSFAVINHSNADLSDLALNVALRPTTAKPGDAPFCTVTATVPSLPADSMRDATAECSTNLRVYELPDWQFIRPSFQITSPPM